MTTQCRQSQQRRAFGTNLLGLCVAMVLSAPAILTMPSAAIAAPITYNFSPSVMAVFPTVPAETDTISGTFTLDPTGSPFGPTLNSVDLTVTGPVHPGTYNEPLGGPGAIETPGEIDVLSAGAGAGFSVFFANALGNAPDNATAVGFFSPSILNSSSITQGTAVPVPAPPIGHSLPVLLAVGGILFGAKALERGKRRRVQFG